MLLIAVTGPVGSGKTTRLSELAEWARARGKRVDGFVARAGVRALDPLKAALWLRHRGRWGLPEALYRSVGGR